MKTFQQWLESVEDSMLTRASKLGHRIVGNRQVGTGRYYHMVGPTGKQWTIHSNEKGTQQSMDGHVFKQPEPQVQVDDF